MNSHLVTVEVGVERCTYKRMKLDSLTFNEYGFKCLDTKAVKCGSTVEHYGVVFDYNLKSIPYTFFLTVNCLSCSFDMCSFTCFNKSLHYEGLEEFKCHFLRKTALINLETGAYNDNRTAGIVNTLTEKVLTETALLTLKHFRK